MSEKFIESAVDRENFQYKDLQLLEGASNYDDMGKVNYKFFPFKPFKKLVQSVAPLVTASKSSKPLSYSGFINSPVHTVFEIVTNLDYRQTISNGVDEVKYKKSRVNRVGTKHTCLVNGKNLEFETVKSDFGKNTLSYGERITSLPIVKDFTTYNILEGKEGGTMLKLEVHFTPLPFIGWIFTPIFKRKFKATLPNLFKVIQKLSVEYKH